LDGLKVDYETAATSILEGSNWAAVSVSRKALAGLRRVNVGNHVPIPGAIDTATFQLGAENILD
jgi:hypothetical protein